MIPPETSPVPVARVACTATTIPTPTINTPTPAAISAMGAAVAGAGSDGCHAGAGGGSGCTVTTVRQKLHWTSVAPGETARGAPHLGHARASTLGMERGYREQSGYTDMSPRAASSARAGRDPRRQVPRRGH